MTSALTLQRFTNAMTYVGPIAKQTGVSLEETTAILAVLANNGVLASRSGTSVRRIMVSLADETGTLTQKLEKLREKNIGVADAEDEVGKYAMTALLALTQNAELLPKYIELLENANGATSEMSRIISDNLAGDVTYMKSTWDALMLSIDNGEGILSKISRAFVQFTTWVINNWLSMSTNVGKAWDYITGIFMSEEALLKRKMEQEIRANNQISASEQQLMNDRETIQRKKKRTY